MVKILRDYLIRATSNRCRKDVSVLFIARKARDKVFVVADFRIRKCLSNLVEAALCLLFRATSVGNEVPSRFL